MSGEESSATPVDSVSVPEAEVNQAPTATPAGLDKRSDANDAPPLNGVPALDADISSSETTVEDSEAGKNAGDKRDHDEVTAEDDAKPVENPEKKQKPEESGEREEKKETTSDSSNKGENGTKKKGPGRPKKADETAAPRAKKLKKRSPGGIGYRTRSKTKAQQA